MGQMVYFDNAATTKISEVALHTYCSVSEQFWANPSSIHREGLKAKSELERCRGDLATALRVKPDSLTFTSGATEADSLILQNYLWSEQCGDIIIPNIEHDAVTGFTRLLRQRGWNVILLDAPKGFVRAEDVKAALSEKTRLVEIMLVNNVVGTIQDVQAIVSVVREQEKKNGRKIHIHSDATQALGKIPFSLTELGVDSAAFSAHKLHGPRGIGLLYNIDPAIVPLSRGGGQERGLRPGTENLPAIAAFTVAATDALQHLNDNRENARLIEKTIREKLKGHVDFLTPEQNATPFILNLTQKVYPSEVLTRMLYDLDFCVSSGSACSNNAKQHNGTILSAMKYSPNIIQGSMRLSFSSGNTVDEAEAFSSALLSLLEDHNHV